MDLISKRMILIYILAWGFVISVSSLGIYGLFVPSLMVRIMTIVHVLAFVIGFRCVRISRNEISNFNLDFLNKGLDKLTNSILFKVVSCVLTCYIWTLVVKFFEVLATANLADMRSDFYEGGMYGSLFDVIDGPILSIFNIIALPIFSWMIFYKRRPIMIVLGVYLFGYAALGGGRLGFLIIFIELIFISICIFLTEANRYKRLRQLSIFGFSVIIIIALTTSLRLDISTSGKNATKNVIEATVEQITSYAVAPISALDYAINNNYSKRIHGYKYGRLTMSSFEAFLSTLLNKIGINYDQALDDLVEIKQDEFINVGRDKKWNALYTSNLYYYLDFGYWGMALFPFIFGMLFRYILKILYKTKSISILILLSYVFSIVVLSFIDYKFVKVFPFILVVVLYIIGRKQYKTYFKI